MTDTDRGDQPAAAEPHHHCGKDCRLQASATVAESPRT